MKIHTLLVANRGEIALRVMRSATALGIRTVAIHTDLDATAPHVHAADDALRVGSYLDIDAVVEAARLCGADAIHPGYGFLSERAAFARAVEAAGIKLVGPSATVMDRMGRKDAAREIAVAAGVPVVPRGDAAGPGVENGEWQGPVLVKAAAGGGGKGMRIVRAREDYDEAVAAARRESLSAFGDDTMLVEKYVEHGRHIEVQVLADSHGDVVHLFERDCSTQRRHQKVLEEAPAPTISEEVRELVTRSAVALAKQVGYENAGTVEFLLDTSTGEAYFLEMNTRLQVEHPVTEAIVSIGGEGLDLVAQQLRVAAGEPLGFGQEDVRRHGHAIEARVYAEDPFDGFLPQAGTASLVRWPERARVDAALESGQVVSSAYDPMLGKVIVHGPDRESARRSLVEALDDTAILGLITNVGFLRLLAASEEFRDATIDTAWLDAQSFDEGSLRRPPEDLARVFAAWTAAMLVAADGYGERGHPFLSDGFRLGAEPAPIKIELDRVLVVDRHRGLVDTTPVVELSAALHVVRLSVDGRLHQAVVNVTAHAIEVVLEGQRHVFHRPDVFADSAAAIADGALLAKMPGTLLAVDVAAGDRVTEGQTLGVLEAMKMEVALKAPFDGTVARVGARTGDQVSMGALLFLVEPDTEEQD
jgi:acetyl-CoA/propionyl-CoA carboxylase biotin carboxyl carrier protein